MDRDWLQEVVLALDRTLTDPRREKSGRHPVPVSRTQKKAPSIQNFSAQKIFRQAGSFLNDLSYARPVRSPPNEDRVRLTDWRVL